MKTFLIIPAYNEEKHIAKVVARAKEFIDDIVVVDDGSKDKTVMLARKENVKVLTHKVNKGKGAALATGCEYAIKAGAEQLIFMDSDGQHEPEDIPRFLSALKKSDIVFGARVKRKEMPVVFKLGNWIINKTNKLLFGLDLKDTQSGYRAMTAEAYKKIKWRSTGYSVESEMIANAGKHKLKYKEIPIKTIYSDRYKGTTVLDGIKIVIDMVRWRISKQ